jgi:hypothetical protein
VEVAGRCSEYFKVDHGSGQGSILGPVLFNYYMSPLVKEKNILSYADDNYLVAIGKTKVEAVVDLQRQVIEAEQWMSGSGLKVNMSKTEFVIFHRHDTGKGELQIGEHVIQSKSSMNVLGIQFDSRLTWEEQADNAIRKSRGSLHALRTLRKFFTQTEMIKLVTANVYSVLYYGSLVWLLPNLKEKTFKKLYSHSGQIMKIVDNNLSYRALHKKFVRATPKIFSLYQSAVNLYHISHAPFNIHDMENAVLTNRRNVRLSFVRCNRYRVGLNIVKNRMRSITSMIDKEWLNLSLDLYKLKCKIRIIQSSLESL